MQPSDPIVALPEIGRTRLYERIPCRKNQDPITGSNLDKRLKNNSCLKNLTATHSIEV
jgi:hypothetical protein